MRFSASALVLIAGLLLAGPVFAVGSLLIEPGARENGMGGAGVALADEVTGMTWWNPAGLGFVKRAGVQMTNVKLVPDLMDDVAFNHLAFVQPMEGWGGLALSVAFLSYGSSIAMDENLNEGPSFSSYEFWSGLSYGVELWPDLAIGCNVKFIRMNLATGIANAQAATVGFDLGCLYLIQPARLRLGANIQHLGPGLVFNDEGHPNPLPRNIKIGFAWEAFNRSGLTSALIGDFNKQVNELTYSTYNGGLEVKYSTETNKGIGAIGLAGRFGYLYDPDGDRKNLTYGLGLNWGSLTLDYGSIPQARDLAYVEKFSLGYRF